MGPSALIAPFMDDLDDNGKEPFIDLNGNHIYDDGIDNFITNCGTPESPNGEANMEYVHNVASEIGKNIDVESIIVNKSTVRVGTAG